MSSTPTICTECDKYTSCRSLCPAMERYVNQDAVEQRELTIGLPRYGNGSTFVSKSNEELIISLYFYKRYRVMQIANMLSVTHGFVSQIVNKYKKIIASNLKK